ncbi:hypothetical protein D1007_57855 [Hordeum vulgare]|nr:hypothetical protein D1007_57855 [Hordeum vulgare]
MVVRGGGAVRGARGQVKKEPPDSASNRGNAAETFEFAINFFPSKAKLVDGSIENIQRDTIVKWEVDCAEIDPHEIQSMEEKAVRKLVEKIGETVLWGPEQEVSLLRHDDFKGEYVRIEDGEDIVVEIDRQEGWASLMAEFLAELVDLNIDSKVEEGNVNVVDWNEVELEEPTDLVTAPIADTEMAKLFGIPVDDRDEEERDEANTSDNDDRELSDVDEQLMKDAADDVDDAHDEELVHVYDKENPVIRVGKLWPNMHEFRLSFKTYAVRHQFDDKTVWTDRKKFYAKCRGFDGNGRRACKWRKLPSQPIVVEQCWPTKRARVSGSRRQTSQWMEQFGAASDEIEVVHTVETEAVHTIETIETEAVHTVETEVVHTVETEIEAVHTVETEVVHTLETETEAVHTVETEADIEFHEAIASSPVKKTKMISELVCAVQPKTRNAKAKKVYIFISDRDAVHQEQQGPEQQGSNGGGGQWSAAAATKGLRFGSQNLFQPGPFQPEQAILQKRTASKGQKRSSQNLFQPLFHASQAFSSDSSVSSDSKYLAIGTTLPAPLSELPQFSICGTPPKLSSQVAATLESM